MVIRLWGSIQQRFNEYHGPRKYIMDTVVVLSFGDEIYLAETEYVDEAKTAIRSALTMEFVESYVNLGVVLC